MSDYAKPINLAKRYLRKSKHQKAHLKKNHKFKNINFYTNLTTYIKTFLLSVFSQFKLNTIKYLLFCYQNCISKLYTNLT